jgi:hypothetical protein
MYTHLQGCTSRAGFVLCLAVLLGLCCVRWAGAAETTDDLDWQSGLGAGWEQLDFIAIAAGTAFQQGDGHASVSVLALRGAYWGPLGVELQLYEWLHPGGSTNRDKHSFLPLYVHLIPWVVRRGRASTYPREFQAFVVDAFVGGSAWAYRTDNEERPDVVDEPAQGWDWGHQYLRGGVRLIRATETTSLGVEYGVVVSRPDGGPDVDDVSQYLAVYAAVGLSDQVERRPN